MAIFLHPDIIISLSVIPREPLESHVWHCVEGSVQQVATKPEYLLSQAQQTIDEFSICKLGIITLAVLPSSPVSQARMNASLNRNTTNSSRQAPSAVSSPLSKLLKVTVAC